MAGQERVTPEFTGLDAYWKFSREIRHGRRFAWTAEVTDFLNTVRATIRDRDRTVPTGFILFRAQVGIEWDDIRDDNGAVISEEPVGFGRTRMSPRKNLASDGRANAAGVPVLYLASHEETAISEVRPWIGSAVSLAQFRTRRPLRALDLSVRHGKSSLPNLKYLMGDAVPDAATKEEAIWTEIDNAFSRPVTRSDDGGDYAPTQILADLFRAEGYDAIVYRSQFGELGFNIVLFHIEDAEPINCAPYEVTSIKVDFKEIGNRWFKSEPRDDEAVA